MLSLLASPLRLKYECCAKLMGVVLSAVASITSCSWLSLVSVYVALTLTAPGKPCKGVALGSRSVSPRDCLTSQDERQGSTGW